jgi:hypothetical protein
VFKISLSSLIPQIELDEAAIAYIVITKSIPNPNPNLNSSGGGYKKKRKTKRQRAKCCRKTKRSKLL